jgi:hypothetical protein
MSNSHKLTDSKESAIIQYILDLDARYSPPRLVDVEAMANRLLVERDMPPVGKYWALNFARRQPQLKTRIFWIYDY